MIVVNVDNLKAFNQVIRLAQLNEVEIEHVEPGETDDQFPQLSLSEFDTDLLNGIDCDWFDIS